MKWLLVLYSCLMLFGCATPFFKAVDGVDTEIAISIPNDDTVKVQLLHYLSGEKVCVKDPSIINYSFKHSETNSYMYGLIETQSYRDSNIIVDPTITNNFKRLQIKD